MLVLIESNFWAVAQLIALAVESVAIASVAIGAAEAARSLLRNAFAKGHSLVDQRGIWLRFSGWILLSLEFALGADVIRTAIAPSWDDIGKLGAIAVIRTALSYFLARDIEQATARAGPGMVKTDS